MRAYAPLVLVALAVAGDRSPAALARAGRRVLLRAVAPAARHAARFRWGHFLTLCAHAGRSYYLPHCGAGTRGRARRPFRPLAPARRVPARV